MHACPCKVIVCVLCIFLMSQNIACQRVSQVIKNRATGQFVTHSQVVDMIWGPEKTNVSVSSRGGGEKKHWSPEQGKGSLWLRFRYLFYSWENSDTCKFTKLTRVQVFFHLAFFFNPFPIHKQRYYRYFVLPINSERKEKRKKEHSLR